MSSIIDFILHIDKHLIDLIANYGIWIYLILFIIVFSETGFVVTPFLPGDSLLFAAGAIAAIGQMNFFYLYILLISAAVLGNFVNYFIGYRFGSIILSKKIIRQSYIDSTYDYFQKYGKTTIVISRFVPIVRTITPFISGIGKMKSGQFALYNIIGAVLWVSIFLTLGYFVGNIEFVKKNFSVITLSIIAISMIPLGITIYKQAAKTKNKAS